METNQKAVIVGSGIVGRAWAVIFARGGFNVSLFDISKPARELAVKEVRKMIKVLDGKGLLFGKKPEDVGALISAVDSLPEALRDAVYAQECVPENLALKTKVFADIDKAATEVKNDSLIMDLKHKAQCLIAHPVNPPFAIPVVEVIPGPFTSGETVQTTRKIMSELQMSPAVLLKEIDGFLVNRMQYALLAEAYRLVDDDVASPQDVDLAISKGLGLRWSFMGPFQTIDLNAPGGVEDYFHRYGSSISRVIKSMDNNRNWNPKTIERIHKAMREETPVDKLGERLRWRNERLLNLAVHKSQQTPWSTTTEGKIDDEKAVQNSAASKGGTTRSSVKEGKVVIVGSGIVGRCWAAIFARGGFPVKIYDVTKEAMDTAIIEIRKLVGMMHDNGLLRGKDPEEVASRVSCARSLDTALKGAVYLQECVPENLSIKKAVFQQIDQAMSKSGNGTCILGSSSSNMYISQFTSELKNRANCLVCHPVNPPFAIPIVEVVPAVYTNTDIVSQARDLLKEMGLSPAVLKKEVDGFLVNRMQYALLAEAFRLVDDGAASPEDVDVAISQGLGLRWSFMGPFQTIDLNAPGGVDDYFKRYGSAISRVIGAMDNARPWRKETVSKIHKAMRKEVPTQSRDARLQWRNQRLLKLAVHELNCVAQEEDAKERGNPATYQIAWVTAPKQEVGEQIAAALVDRKLAACVNIIQGITSVYVWEGKVEKDSEVLLMIKTRKNLIKDLISCVEQIHPYDCPEVITTSIADGRKGYLEWIGNSTRKQ